MRDFTKGSVGQSIFLFSLPIILGNLFQQLYTFVNSAIVGCFLGDKALAAVGSVYPIVFFLVSLIIGIGSGGSVLVSHFFGAKGHEQIPLVVSTFYIFFLGLGIVVSLASIIFAPWIFSLLGLEAAIRLQAVAYMRVYMLGMFFSFCFNSAVSILRGLGDSRTQLGYLIGANVLNALLSYIFIAKFHLSLVSTAWASVISQLLATLLLFLRLQKCNEYFRFGKQAKYFDKENFRELLRIGLPTGVQQSVVALSQILILGLVAKFGTDAVAAYSAASRIESIALLFVLNLSSALTSFAGQNFGAGNTERVRKGLRSSLMMMTWLSLVTFVIFFFFPNELMGLFSDTQEVCLIGKEYLQIMGLFWILFAFMNTFTSFFRGLGYTFVPMLISIISLWLLRLPLSYLLSLFRGTEGIWLGAPLSWLLGVLCFLVYYKKSRWHKKKTFGFTSMSVLLFCLCCSANTKAQSSCSDYLSPLTIPLSSSGHFAELRTNHFHSGIDLRTQGRENQYVICPYDGYVSRIKIQVYGGGKNLYIDHTNGYTTVYMHLNAYWGRIGEYVKEYQYKNKCYAFDINLPKGGLKLKKGDTIALSGNTGSSGGPHLHYEIRQTASQRTINPILKGLPLQDSIAPELYAFRLLPCDEYSTLMGNNTAKLFDLKKDTTFKYGDTIIANGNFYLCVEAYDRSNGSTAKNGVYDTRIFTDNNLLFRYNNSDFSFSDSRYANAIIDYAYFKQSGRRMLWTKQLPPARIRCVDYRDGGIITSSNGQVQEIRILLSDERDNASDFVFYLKGELQNPNIALLQNLSAKKTREAEQLKNIKTYTIDRNKTTTISLQDSSSLYFPENSLYENLDLNYSYSKGKFSLIHSIHNNRTPLHKSINLKLRYNNKLEPYKSKALVVSIDDKGRRSSVGDRLEGRYIVCSVSNFGTYTVDIDTIAPVCKAKNFISGNRIKPKQKSIQVKISDNLSGISSYNAYLNGKWLLAEYDGKSGTLIMAVKDFPKGRSELKIILSDTKNNTSTHRFTIIR